MNDLDRERLAEVRANQQAQAVRTVDDHAIDDQDREMLISMLGLDSRGPLARTPHVGPLN